MYGLFATLLLCALLWSPRRDRSKVSPYVPYIKLLTTAMKKVRLQKII
jgi:hypothetical protein